MSSRAKISSSTLPRMRFTKEDVQHYHEISDACLAEVLDKYEEYLYQGERHIDERRWKKVKSRESVVVYRERSTSDADLSNKSGHDFGSSSSSNSSGPAYHARHDTSTAVETVSNGPLSGLGAALAAGTKIPVMICTASIPGTLEDAMYGSYVDDAASFRRRSAYEQDLADDIGMLATFDRPSQKDPFQFMGLTWVLRSFPGLGAVVKPRDFLLLQRIGLSRTSRGELLGFTITQSVPHRDLPELPQYEIIRGKLSTATIYRQMGDLVDVFVQIVMQPGGNALNYFMIQETATSIMSVGKPMDVAQNKKLFWLMRKNAVEASMTTPRSPSTRSASSSSSSSTQHRLQRHESDHCAACKKSLARIFSTAGSFCQICQKRVCSRCSVTKKLVIDASEKTVVIRPFNFCLGCSLTARSYSPLQVHAEELAQRTRR
ncbi:NADH-ubiquinone oxidoreductase chain 5 [Phytophthora cinnamomi]|uniref:NADH-ubiquinone oxidoreductase chain 5 n=1 Tax=Phytophthora cinnamomi TaxID=4785 RepID=UPI0035599DDF|nr:NADH-ubiquinone oxidoreductase chain 5 [Phytophthora cinnamomi]